VRLRAAAGALLRRMVSGARRDPPADEYIDWLCFANAGMLDRGNLFCLDHAIRNLPSDAPVVEIGSFCGLSTNVMTHYLSKAGRSNALLTCEPWTFEGATQADAPLGKSSIRHSEYRAFVRDAYLRNISFFSRARLPYTVECDSDRFFEGWRRGDSVRDVLGRDVKLGGPISLAYIDGNHTYECARRDFENCHAHIERGGFILFDDSADGSGWEVCRVVREAVKDGMYEVALRNPNYLLKKR
jgi:hypothetical protein